LDFLFFLRQLAEDIETDWPKVKAALEDVHKSLLDRSGMLCNVTVDSADWAGIEPQLEAFISDLPLGSGETQTWKPTYTTNPEGLTIPAQVNYVGKGLSLYAAGYDLHGSISVINNYLGTTWLWEKIRVQGGAYGGFSTFDQLSGVFNYLSYRDPNLLGSLENYNGTGQFLRGLDLSPDELFKSVIGAIGRIDAYMFPDAKGFTSMQRYLTNQSDDFIQNFRDQVLSTTRKDFIAFGELLDAIKDDDRVVVLGALEGLMEANAEMGGDWIKIQKVV
jgi:Zn-dependent M16 (insulinase) family peptidase